MVSGNQTSTSSDLCSTLIALLVIQIYFHSPGTVDHVDHVIDGDTALSNVGGQNHLHSESLAMK